MSQQKIANRNLNFDILRIIACVFVVVCHVSSVELSKVSIFTESYISSHILNGIGHTGSIIFLFLSGALLLSEDYEFQAKKFYLNNFLKLLVAYQAWVIIYNVIEVVWRGKFEWIYWKDVIINSIAGKACYHFWYLPVLLGIYLILPMLRSICKDKKSVAGYFVGLFFVVQILFKTILLFDFPYKYLVDYLLNRIPYTLVNHYVGYFVLGYFLNWLIKEKKIKKQALFGALLFFGGMVVGLLGDMFLSVKAGITVASFNDLFTLSSFLSGVGIFLWGNARSVTLGQKGRRVVEEISKLTFGIYVIHPLFMEQILPLWDKMDVLPRFLLIIILVVITFVVSMIAVWLLSKIPIVNEWLLFCGKKQRKIEKKEA